MEKKHVLNIVLVFTTIIIISIVVISLYYPTINIEYWDNGNIKQEYFTNINGKVDGFISSYDENGNLIRKTEFNNDKQTGHDSLFYPNGVLKEVAYFDNGISIDSIFTFHPNGNIKLKGNMNNGAQFGEYRLYHTNGLIEEIGILNENGNLDGPFRKYDENGNLIWLEDIKDGVTYSQVDFLPSNKILVRFINSTKKFKVSNFVKMDTLLSDAAIFRAHSNKCKIMLGVATNKDLKNTSIDTFKKVNKIESELEKIMTVPFNKEKVNIYCHNDECIFTYFVKDIYVSIHFKKSELSNIDEILSYIYIG